MGMSVYGVGGVGIIIESDDAEFEGLWGLPEGLVCHEVGAYREERAYFFGAGAAVSWNKFDTTPRAIPDAEQVKEAIKAHLEAEGYSNLYREQTFGLHIFPYVS